MSVDTGGAGDSGTQVPVERVLAGLKGRIAQDAMDLALLQAEVVTLREQVSALQTQLVDARTPPGEEDR